MQDKISREDSGKQSRRAPEDMYLQSRPGYKTACIPGDAQDSSLKCGQSIKHLTSYAGSMTASGQWYLKNSVLIQLHLECRKEEKVFNFSSSQHCPDVLDSQLSSKKYEDHLRKQIGFQYLPIDQ